MTTTTYETPLVLSGPLRLPVNMLVHQVYDGHKSLHDGDVAAMATSHYPLGNGQRIRHVPFY